jgi:serine protease inhibitor
VIVNGSSAASSGLPPPPVPMVVNRPFLMSIVDIPTGAVLFVGHVEDPTNGGE